MAHAAGRGLAGLSTGGGQRVDLCARIHDILRSYPEGSSIAKEL